MAAAGGGITKILNPGLYRCPARRSRDLETILSYDSRFRKVVAMFASGIVSEIVPSLPCKPTGRGVVGAIRIPATLAPIWMNLSADGGSAI
jgi:hypothetical protein